MAGMIGNNPQDMAELANKIAQAVQQINQLISSLTAKASSVQWEGPDAKKFKGTDWPHQKTQLTKIANDLETTKTVILKQKAEQEATSAK